MREQTLHNKYKVRDKFVQVPEDDYRALVERLEDAEDQLALRRAEANIEEYYPAALVQRLLDGEAPVTVFRNYRGLSQAELAERADVTQATISEIESGRKQGSVTTLKAIAAALETDLDELV